MLNYFKNTNCRKRYNEKPCNLLCQSQQLFYKISLICDNVLWLSSRRSLIYDVILELCMLIRLSVKALWFLTHTLLTVLVRCLLEDHGVISDVVLWLCCPLQVTDFWHCFLTVLIRCPAGGHWSLTGVFSSREQSMTAQRWWRMCYGSWPQNNLSQETGRDWHITGASQKTTSGQ